MSKIGARMPAPRGHLQSMVRKAARELELELEAGRQVSCEVHRVQPWLGRARLWVPQREGPFRASASSSLKCELL